MIIGLYDELLLLCEKPETISNIKVIDTKYNKFKVVLLFIFSKSLKTYKAILSLYNNGFYEDAIILSRSIFESYVNIAYIVIDYRKKNKKVTRYIRYFKYTENQSLLNQLDKSRLKESKLYRKSKINSVRSGSIRFKHRYHNDKSWSGMNLKEMWNSINTKADLYPIYKNHSQYVHPSFNISDFYITLNNNTLNVNQTSMNNNSAMYITFMSMILILAICDKVFKLNIRAEVEDLSKRYLESVKP